MDEPSITFGVLMGMEAEEMTTRAAASSKSRSIGTGT